MTMIGVLVLAWILSCFELDITLISAVNELFGTDYSTAVYWLVAFIVGCIAALIEYKKS